MDQDQFGGRTDDDLFSDDIEPVEETVTLSAPTPAPINDAPAQPAPAPAPAPAAQQPASAPPKPARSSLAQSRHNPNAQQSKPSRPAASNKNNNQLQPTKSDAGDTPSTTEPSASATTQKPPPTGPREPSSTTRNNNNNNNATPTPSNNTASAVSAARLNSGANPRTKLTEAELAERMEKMRLLAAEKTRRFEQAQRDETEHAAALAKGMEEARKRKAEEAARRKVAEEERKKLEDERAKNRERKLKALEGREGWDLGRDMGELEGEEGRRGFRSAHGGIRGARGMGASRFAGGGGVDEGGEYDGFGLRGRGGGFRGRGGRGRGRGGGRLFDEREGEYPREQGRPSAPGSAPPPPKKADLKPEDFPALPSSTAAPKKVDTTWVPKPGAAEIPLSPPIGKWDEEVAASLDANQTTS